MLISLPSFTDISSDYSSVVCPIYLMLLIYGHVNLLSSTAFARLLSINSNSHSSLSRSFRYFLVLRFEKRWILPTFICATTYPERIPCQIRTQETEILSKKSNQISLSIKCAALVERCCYCCTFRERILGYIIYI